ncbi:MAG: hypothetical protein MI922_21045, partial [Bacteroidales bacterium]|nr:hypothetical protein [Bacteroidales bacterium]
TYYSIDKITINLGEIEANSILKELSDKTISLLDKHLGEIFIHLSTEKTNDTESIELNINAPSINHNNQFLSSIFANPGESEVRRETKNQRVINIFLFFIEHGRFPWWSSIMKVSDLEKQLQGIKSIEREKLVQQVRSTKLKKECIERLVFQFSKPFVFQLIEWSFANWKLTPASIEKQLISIYSKQLDKTNKSIIEKEITNALLWVSFSSKPIQELSLAIYQVLIMLFSDSTIFKIHHRSIHFHKEILYDVSSQQKHDETAKDVVLKSVLKFHNKSLFEFDKLYSKEQVSNSPVTSDLQEKDLTKETIQQLQEQQKPSDPEKLKNSLLEYKKTENRIVKKNKPGSKEKQESETKKTKIDIAQTEAKNTANTPDDQKLEDKKGTSEKAGDTKELKSKKYQKNRSKEPEIIPEDKTTKSSNWKKGQTTAEEVTKGKSVIPSQEEPANENIAQTKQNIELVGSKLETETDAPIMLDDSKASSSQKGDSIKESYQVENNYDLNELYISNSGLVIIHPFLQSLFNEIGLLSGKDFKNRDSQVRAVHLLQFIANSGDKSPENELVFNKLMCGMPLDMPIEKEIDLLDSEKEQAKIMLKSAIMHWKALKSTSIDGLRDGFFMRDGRLVKKPQGWFLTVEKKTIDILMNTLPWTISVIKFPWRKDMIHVEWN